MQLPWKTPEYKEIDIEKAREILEQEHYGIEKVKTRIIQHLAVMKLKKEKKGSIILLVGLREPEKPVWAKVLLMLWIGNT